MPTTTISRCGGTAGGYPTLVQTIGPSGTLRGYWRLGQTSPPLLDTSGWVSGPSPMTGGGGAVPPVYHVAGGLSPGQDDGAVEIPTDQDLTNVWASSTAMFGGVMNGWSCALYAKPFPSAKTFRGGIFCNQGLVAGAPSHEEGWSCEGYWAGGVVQARLTRVRNNVAVSAAATIAQNTYTHCVFTYDGATSRVYLNGVPAASQADATAMIADNTGQPTIGALTYGPPATPGEFVGCIDEVAFWGTVLTAANIADLYAAG